MKNMKNQHIWFTYINDVKTIIDAVSTQSETAYDLTVFKYVGKHLVVSEDGIIGNTCSVHCFVLRSKLKED